MLVLTTPTVTASLSGRKCAVSASSPNKFVTKPDSDFCSSRVSDPCSGFIRPQRRRVVLTLAESDGGVNSSPSTSFTPPTTPSQSPFAVDETVFVGQENVPLEGVIQFDKPSSSSSAITKWGRVALLAGGDVLALLLFSAIGRFNHGLPLLSIDTLHTADPFIAGWFLSAYFLGGYAEEGRGMKGRSKAVIAAAKSWVLGAPLGLAIRSVTSGHIPPSSFILVTMGSTSVLLIGWRALLFSVLPNESKKKKDDTYRRGNPFELFELLTSLVRRW